MAQFSHYRWWTKTKIMKKILIAFITVTTFAACNNGKKDIETTKDVVLVDTTGMYKSNILTDTGSMIITQPLTSANKGTNHTHSTAPNTKRRTTSNQNNSNTSTSNGSGNTQTTSSGETTTQQKTGWSKAAKGAVIGGVGGAVTGAVISKNKTKGAIIGGVLGAGGGYILGRSKDKKDGRVK